MADPEPEDAAGAPTRFGQVLLKLVRSPVFYLLAFATGTLWFCIVAMLNNQALFFRTELLLDDTSTTADLQQLLCSPPLLERFCLAIWPTSSTSSR